MEPEATSTGAPVSPTALLSHTDWIRSLARSLVRDAAAADDLTQETLLVALKGKPQDARRLRSWLAGVARHLAQNEHRRARARGDSEAESALNTLRLQSPKVDQAATLARAEAHRTLVDHVLEMPEPSRSLLLERYFEKRRPVDIAKLRGISPAAVHAGLTRAHAALRETLERQGGRLEWMGMLGPLLIPLPAHKAGAAAVSSQTGVGAGSTVHGTSGITLGVGALSLIAVAAIIMTLRSGTTESVRPEKRHVAEGLDGQDLGAPAGPRVTLGPTDAVKADGQHAEMPKHSEVVQETAQESIALLPARMEFRGRCVDEDQMPVAQTTIGLFQAWDGRPEYWETGTAARSVAETTTDRNGRFAFADVEVGSYVVGSKPTDPMATSWLSPVDVDEPEVGGVPAEGQTKAPFVERAITLRGGHWITGRVEYRDGTEPARIQLMAFRDDVAIQAMTTCMLDGTFRFGPLAAGSYVVTSAGGADVPWGVAATSVTARSTNESSGASITLPTIKARRLEGRVSFDKAIKGAVREGTMRVSAYEVSGPMKSACIAQSVVASDGSYKITGIGDGPFFLSYESRDGQHVAYETMAMDPWAAIEGATEESLAGILENLAARENALQARPSVIVWLQPGQFRNQGPLTVTCEPWPMSVAQHPVGPFGPLRIVVPLPESGTTPEGSVFTHNDVTLKLYGSGRSVLEEWTIGAEPSGMRFIN